MLYVKRENAQRLPSWPPASSAVVPVEAFLDRGLGSACQYSVMMRPLWWQVVQQTRVNAALEIMKPDGASPEEVTESVKALKVTM